MTRRNVHLYPSTMLYESRIDRITRSLANDRLFDEIVLVGLGDGRLPEHETLDGIRRIWRVPLGRFRIFGRRGRRLLRYIQWLARIIKCLRKIEVAVINCHSIYDLPAGVIVKRLKNCKLVYDAHELETERNGMKGMVKRLAKVLERRAMRRVDHLFVVSDSIAAWYRDRYGFRAVTTVFNVPHPFQTLEARGARTLRGSLSIGESDLLFLYAGALVPGRGITLLLSVFAGLGADRHILFLGYGALADKIKTVAALHPNIHYREAVPFSELPGHIREADAGVSIIENICLSYYYCLPNKVFEYLMAGIPVITSDFPEMGSIVDRLRCGWKTPVAEEDLRRLFSSLTSGQLREKKRDVLALRGRLGWQIEENKFLPLYRSNFARAETQKNATDAGSS